VLARLVNATTRRQEFYEAHLVWILPCYELEFFLVKPV
jgi:hypothetical protein